MNLPAPKESEIQRQIAEWLTLNGWLVVRINPHIIKRTGKDGRVHHYKSCSAEGVSDLIAFRLGQFCAIEVKRPGATTDRRRQLQQSEFLDRIRAHGGIGFYARSLEEVIEALQD